MEEISGVQEEHYILVLEKRIKLIIFMINKCIYKFVLLIILGSFYNSCTVSNNITNTTELVESYSYIEIIDSFEMKIITYIPCQKAIRWGNPCVAQYIGIIQNADTIRVLSLSNSTDTMFKENDIVKVIPKKKPDYNVSLSICVEQIDKKHWNLCDWQTKDYKTTYGKLVKH